MGRIVLLDGPDDRRRALFLQEQDGIDPAVAAELLQRVLHAVRRQDLDRRMPAGEFFQPASRQE